MTHDRAKLSLIVHGGAGLIPEEDRPIHATGLQQALDEGWARLQQGETALTAVAAAIEVLENDPIFDAGLGSVLRLDGSIAMDAAIMDGSSRRGGAVAGVSRCPNPIRLARAVLENTPHVLLIGQEAERLAARYGIPSCDPQSLITPREVERLRRILAGGGAEAARGPQGTVGAVAIDCHGNIAAGTSTGGMPGCPPGRVGDSPILGAGTFADNRQGGVSCTGHGESIMQTLLAYNVAQRLAEGLSAAAAAQWGVQYVQRETGNHCGLICIGFSGDLGAAYSTQWMGVAQRTGGQPG